MEQIECPHCSGLLVINTKIAKSPPYYPYPTAEEYEEALHQMDLDNEKQKIKQRQEIVETVLKNSR